MLETAALNRNGWHNGDTIDVNTYAERAYDAATWSIVKIDYYKYAV